MLSEVLQKSKIVIRRTQHRSDIKKLAQVRPLENVEAVHISIDDVHQIFLDAFGKREGSVFEFPVLSQIKRIHEEFGAKFTLYCFEDPMHRISDQYCEELSKAEWLKFGYHADSDGSVSVKGYQSFNKYYSDRGVSISNTLRLHMFDAPLDMIRLLESEGDKRLLCSDDARTSYGIPPWLFGGGYQARGIKYTSTDIRLEKMITPIVSSDCFHRRRELVVFGHEQPFMRYREYDKLVVLLRLFRDDIQYEL